MNNHNLLLQLSELSKIKFSADEISEFCDDFFETVTLMDKVKLFDTNPANISRPTLNYKDIPTNNTNFEKVTHTQNKYFVPKIIQENL